MARRIYIGSSNSSRNVKSMYIGVSGAVRKVTKGYIGENNVARIFYPRYAWDKYSISTVRVYERSWVYGGQFALRGYEKDGGFELTKSFEFDKYSGDFTFKNIVFYAENDDYDIQIPYGTYYVSYMDFSGYGSNSVVTTECNNGSKCYELEYDGFAYYNNRYYESRLTYGEETSEGDFVEMVYSNDENAYPDNGMSGDYWYIRK